MQEKQNSSLIWFRNDLRLRDNTSVSKALKNSSQIVAVYCFDPRQFSEDGFGFKKTEKFRARFLIETIADLKSELAPFNIPLFIYQDFTEASISKLHKQFHFNTIYFQKEWTPEELDISEKVLSVLPEDIKTFETYNQFLYHPEDLHLSFKAVPEVFTAFRKKVQEHSKIRPETHPETTTFQQEPIQNDTKSPSLKELGFDDFETHPNTAFPFKGGETEAIKRLEDYFFTSKKLGVYKKTRNGLIGTDFSSKFSPWLANGSLSARTIYWQVKQFEKEQFKNDSTYWLVFELLWRDYFKYVSLKHKKNIFQIGGLLNKEYLWNRDSKLVKQWINGQTGEPFVDANMLELKKTGWMSNRGRQNVASYFAKTLNVDWRIGAAYFESQLLDYDVHSNYGNWMYVSGVGNDPRDRTFNVKRQAERYDSAGKFQRLWLQNTLF